MKLPPTLAMAVHAIPGERGCQAAKTASRSETISGAANRRRIKLSARTANGGIRETQAQLQLQLHRSEGPRKRNHARLRHLP
jgi:hypothetical protein